MLAQAALLCLSSLFASDPVVEVEEAVATCEPPDNGAGPLWCYGAPLLVRRGNVVFASVLETGQGVPPLCNTRWRLFAREDDAGGWRLVNQAEGFRSREPCPLVSPSPGSLVLSVNPSTEPPGTKYGRCRPGLLRFDAAHPDRPPVEVLPWEPGAGHFTDHSYRGLAADAGRGEVLVLNIDASTSAQHWALIAADGRLAATGAISFPIRGCYPQVVLRDRAAHVLAIGDIVEPNEAWRNLKKQKTGQSWDYVFRRLFYAWSPDLARPGFSAPVEIDTVDATGGHITNLDLWLDAHGHAHLLYLKTTSTPIICDHAFRGRPIATTLEHVEVADGQVVGRSTLAAGGEGASETLDHGRFHADAAGSLWVVESISGHRPDGSAFHENRVAPVSLRPGETAGAPAAIPLKTPFSTFFTAAERGGSRPSNTIDLFGTAGDARTLRYARVRLPGRRS
jgi:hypothetical protein